MSGHPRITITKKMVTARRIPIAVPFAIAKETLTVADVVLIAFGDEKGCQGVGEAAPFPTLTFDTHTMAAKVATDVAASLVGQTVEEALEALREDRDDIRKTSVTAFTGLEGALLDLQARQRGVSLATLWGTSPCQDHITDITLPLMAADAVGAFWQLYGSYGFPIVKVKVSGRIDDDVAAIAALQRLVPKATALTLDGNQGYREHSARQLIDRLEQMGVRPIFFEQPLPEDDWAGSAALSQQLGIPLCLDETVRTVADVQRAVRDKTATMINIKIMKSGIEESHRMITVAKAAGMQLMIGGMLESEIAMGISLQLAAGTKAIDFYDLDTPFFFKQAVAETSPWHAKKARLVLPDGPGHGMTIAPM